MSQSVPSASVSLPGLHAVYSSAVISFFLSLFLSALFVGSSSALNVAAAVKACELVAPGGTIVTVLCDNGYRHVSRFWNKDFLLENYGLTLLPGPAIDVRDFTFIAREDAGRVVKTAAERAGSTEPVVKEVFEKSTYVKQVEVGVLEEVKEIDTAQLIAAAHSGKKDSSASLLPLKESLDDVDAARIQLDLIRARARAAEEEAKARDRARQEAIAREEEAKRRTEQRNRRQEELKRIAEKQAKSKSLGGKSGAESTSGPTTATSTEALVKTVLSESRVASVTSVASVGMVVSSTVHEEKNTVITNSVQKDLTVDRTEQHVFETGPDP